MTIHDVEEQLESALTGDDADRDYFIRQTLQLLADDREDAPQLDAIEDHLERALDAEDNAVTWLREALGMCIEYRHTGDISPPDPEASPPGFDSERPSAAVLAFEPAAIKKHHTIQKTVTVELPEEIATAVAYRLGLRADRGDPITQYDVEGMACDYAVAREQFTVEPDGQPLAEWLEDTAGLQVLPPETCKETGQSVECQTDSSRRSGEPSHYGGRE